MSGEWVYRNQIYCCGSPQLWKSYQGVAELKRLRTAAVIELHYRSLSFPLGALPDRDRPLCPCTFLIALPLTHILKPTTAVSVTKCSTDMRHFRMRILGISYCILCQNHENILWQHPEKKCFCGLLFLGQLHRPFVHQRL